MNKFTLQILSVLVAVQAQNSWAQVSQTASVSQTVQVFVPPKQLSKETFKISASSILTYHESLEKVNSLMNQLEAEGMHRGWFFNEETISKLNQLIANGNVALLNAEVNSLIQKMSLAFYRGYITPDQLSEQVKITPKKITKTQQDAFNLFIANQLSVENYLNIIRPKNAHYTRLISLLTTIKQSKDAGLLAKVPKTLVAVKAGVAVPAAVIQYARYKLSLLGYTNNTFSTVYDEELKTVIEKFQANNNLTVDGVIGRGAWALLNMNVDQMMTRLRINIDRARWLPDQMGADHVLVNLMTHKLKLYQNSQLTMEFKTINGRIDRPTPIMFDRISRMILNPTWTAPTSIVIKDKAPILAKNPNYAKEIHMVVFDNTTGLEVDPATVDWLAQTEQNLKYTLVQQPGRWNALGLVKFPMGNPYSIYMHDTDKRELFEKPNRLLSSGCIRLEKPFEFAEKVMGDSVNYSLPQLLNLTENLLEPATQSTAARFTKSYPVYLLYMTADINDNGEVALANDFYGVDLMMYNLMVGLPASGIAAPVAIDGNTI